MRDFVRRHSLFCFFAVAYALSWSLWLPAVVVWKLLGSPEDQPWWLLPAGVLGAYGPSAAAIVITGVVEGKPAVRALLRKFLRWRAGVRWYLVVFLLPPLGLAVAMGIYVLQGHSLGRFDAGQWPLVLGLPLLALPFGSLGEELGWRGYALPILQRRHNALASSVILGTGWTFWHAPAFWAPSGTLLSGQRVTLAQVGLYLAFTIGISILITWVFNNTGGSVPIAVLFHTMMNAGILVPLFPDLSERAIAMITKLNVYPVWAVAIAIIVAFGTRRFVRDLPPKLDIYDYRRPGVAELPLESGMPVVAHGHIEAHRPVEAHSTHPGDRVSPEPRPVPMT